MKASMLHSETVLRDLLAGSGIPALARLVSPTPTITTQEPSRPEAPADPLADLLSTPLHKLTAPLALDSSVLGETVWLAANDSQAATVRARGGVPYTPDEIGILWELYQAIGAEIWPARLRLIHEAKRHLGGTVTDYTPAPKTPERERPCPSA